MKGQEPVIFKNNLKKSVKLKKYRNVFLITAKVILSRQGCHAVFSEGATVMLDPEKLFSKYALIWQQ